MRNTTNCDSRRRLESWQDGVRSSELSNILKSLAVLLLLPPLTGCITPRTSEASARAERGQAILGTRATYCSAPRKADGRVDVDRLVSELIAIRANTYSFCIH